jgi:hypothetical protein
MQTGQIERIWQIWIVGSEHWPRAFLRAELIERGHDAVGFATLRDAVTGLAISPSSRPDLIVLDLHELPVADEELVGSLFRYGVPIVAIAGAAEAGDERLRDHPWAAFLRRPITIGAIVESIGARVNAIAPKGP